MRVEPAAAIAGHLAVPGDKSISHRAVLLGLAGEGETRIAGFGRSADTESTLAAARALGATVYEHDDALRIFGVGLVDADAEVAHRLYRRLGVLGAAESRYARLALPHRSP